MTLRKKTLILVAITLIGLISLLYIASRAILLTSFIDLETSLVDRNIMRIENAVQEDLDSLLVSVKDWAYWDDTYQYAQDGNNAYVEDNLADSTFAHFRLNVAMFINADGELLFGKGFDSEEQSGTVLLQSMTEMLEQRDPLFNYIFDPPSGVIDTSGRMGIIRLPEGPLLIGAAPILTSDYEGPITGMLVWGRYLGETELARLAELTRVSVTVQSINEENLPPDFTTASEHLTSGRERYVQALDENRVAGYSLINDVYGNPALILRVASTREVYQRGQSALSYILISLLVAGVVVILVTALLLERLILSRVAWLSNRVSRIEGSGDLTMDVLVSGHDELSYLSQRISRTFQSLRRSQEKIQESEARYAGIFRHSLDAIYLLKVLPNNRFEYETMNPADERGLGLSAEEIAGKTVHELFGLETANIKEQYCRQVVETGEPLQYKLTFEKNGNQQTWQNVLVPIRDASGQIVRILGTAREITEQERAEANLRRQALVFENISDAVIVTDMQSCVVEWNPAAERIYGYPKSEVIGKPLPLATFTKVGQSLTPVISAAMVRDGRWQGELAIIRKDGTERIMEVVTVPLFDAEGKMMAAISMNRDVTERKRAESALREANNTFQALIEASPLAIVVFNSEGIVNLWNPAAERIFGWRAEEAIGKPPVYVQPEKMDEFNQLLTTILSGKSMSNMELRRQRSDGRLIDISISSAPLRAVDGHIYGIMSVMDDVTERKKAKQQELELALERERVRLIADFVRDASHDFRTPLSNIRTSAYLLERSQDAEQRRRRVDVIDEQVNQIDQLVDSLLTITRLNSGVEFSFRLIDLNELLQQVAVKMRIAAERKSLIFTLELNEISPVSVDESYLYQALVNLMQNAVDYTDEGGKITVRTFTEDAYVVVEVSDTGVGIAVDELPFILNRAYRTDRSWSAVGRPGLGLPIAKKIIEGHKGHIDVTSIPKKGSQFRIYLPAIPEVVRPN
jgi:PAS domain S-box-containing protein